MDIKKKYCPKIHRTKEFRIIWQSYITSTQTSTTIAAHLDTDVVAKLLEIVKADDYQVLREEAEAAGDDARIEQYLEDQKKNAGATVSVIELWHRALNEPDEAKPTRKDSIEITQIITNIPGWIQCPNLISTQWGRQKGFRKDNFAALWR